MTPIARSTLREARAHLELARGGHAEARAALRWATTHPSDAAHRAEALYAIAAATPARAFFWI